MHDIIIIIIIVIINQAISFCRDCGSSRGYGFGRGTAQFPPRAPLIIGPG